MTRWLADSSVAVPMVQASHAAHQRVREVVGKRSVGLPAHAAVETYSVLTRLPGDARLAPGDAATLLASRVPKRLALDADTQARLVDDLAAAHVAGGAVYDAIIALTARHHRSALLTRDSRAAATYRALGVEFELVL